VTSGWLFELDDYLDCGVQPENLAVTSMMLRVPVPDISIGGSFARGICYFLPHATSNFLAIGN